MLGKRFRRRLRPRGGVGDRADRRRRSQRHGPNHRARAGRGQQRLAWPATATEAVAALRTTIAVIDNAEAVDPTTVGVGSTEVPRRDLSIADVRAVLHDHIDDYVTEADRYQSLDGSPTQRLRRQTDTLRTYL